MGLLNPEKFESEETSAGQVFASARQTSAPAPAEAPTASLPPAAAAPAAAAPVAALVAVVSGSALAIAEPAYAISEGMKHSIVVDYNTFPQITATNGNFVERESKIALGDTITFELVSFQDSWVVSPGDDKAPNDLVRYSDDGVVCSDGTPVQEHLQFLKAGGYPKASLKQRSVVVGEVLSCSKVAKYNGELVQFDLSPMSRVQWQRYLANSVNSLRKGRKTAEQLKMITATTELCTSGVNIYTKAMFATSAV